MTDLYDLYGCVLSVEGSVAEYFIKEYGILKRDMPVSKVDLYVKPVMHKEDLPTKLAGSVKGLYLPMKDDENILWYNEGVNSYVVMSYCEGLLYWGNKTLLHSGCVSKKGKAYVFTGSGNVGKTSIVLNLARKGFDYLSDDWLIVGNGNAYPFPKTIHIFDYNLKDKDVANKVLGVKRPLYSVIFTLLKIGKRFAPHRYIKFALQNLSPIFYMDIKKLHPEVKIGNISSISKVFYLERWKSNEFKVVGNIDPKNLARRMALINLYERNYFFKEYYSYAAKYDIKNINIESRFEHDIQVLYNTFKTTDVYKILIPDKANLSTSDLSFLPFDEDYKKGLL